MNKSVNSLTAPGNFFKSLLISGAMECMPSAKVAVAIATTLGFHVVDSTPTARRRSEEAVMALLVETSVFDVNNL